jgi:hypothetical protein
VLSARPVRINNLDPMVTNARQKLQTVGVTPGEVLADARYRKSSAIETLVSEGIQTLVARDADRWEDPLPRRRGDLDDPTHRMHVTTDRGKELS